MAESILRTVGVAVDICSDLQTLVRGIGRGVGFALITEEVRRDIWSLSDRSCSHAYRVAQECGLDWRSMGLVTQSVERFRPGPASENAHRIE